MDRRAFGRLSKFINPLFENPAATNELKAEENNLAGLELLHVKRDYSRAVALFSRAHHLSRTEPSYLWHRAEAYLAIAHFHASEVDYRDCLALIKQGGREDSSPTGSPANSSLLIEQRLGFLYLTMAQVMMDTTEYTCAQRYLSLASQYHVKDSSTQLPVMLMQVAQGDYRAALSSIGALLPDSKKPSDLLVLAIRINCLLDDYDAVNAHLKELKKMAPFHSELQKISLYLIKSAIEFKTAADTLFAQTLASRSDTWQMTPEFVTAVSTAIPYYSKALELDPADTASYISRGLVFLWSNQHTKALQDFFSCLDGFQPKTPASKYNPEADGEQAAPDLQKREMLQSLVDEFSPKVQDFETAAELLRERKHTELERLLAVTNWRSAQYQLQSADSFSAKVLSQAASLLDTSLLFDANNGYVHLEKAQWLLLQHLLERRDSSEITHLVAASVAEELQLALSATRSLAHCGSDVDRRWWIDEVPVVRRGPCTRPLFTLPYFGIKSRVINLEVSVAAMLASCQFLTGFSKFSEGEFSLAIEHLEKSTRTFPSVTALMLLANCLCHAPGNKERVRNVLLSVLHIDGGNGTARSLLVEQGSSFDKEKARQEFLKLNERAYWTKEAANEILAPERFPKLQPNAMLSTYQTQLLAEWQSLLAKPVSGVSIPKVPLIPATMQAPKLEELRSLLNSYAVKPLPAKEELVPPLRMKKFHDFVGDSLQGETQR